MHAGVTAPNPPPAKTNLLCHLPGSGREAEVHFQEEATSIKRKNQV